MSRIRLTALWALAAGITYLFSGCEMELGNPETESPTMPTPVWNAPSTGNNAGSNNNNNNNNGGTDDPDDPVDPGQTPGVPSLYGESINGNQVTLAWSDAEHAAAFELVLETLTSDSWKVVAHQADLDDFEFTYNRSDPAHTQFRWKVRSISSDGQVSAFSKTRNFTWP